MTNSTPVTPASPQASFDQMVQELSSKMPNSPASPATPAAGAAPATPPAPGAGMPGMPSSPTPSTPAMGGMSGAAMPGTVAMKAPMSGSSTPTTTKKAGGMPPMKSIITAVVLLLVLVGGGVGFFLTRQRQDTRQQAAGGVVACGDACGDTGYTLGEGINIIDGSYSAPQLARDYDFHIETSAAKTGYTVTTPTQAQNDLYYGGMGRSSAKRWGAAQSFKLAATGTLTKFSIQMDQIFGLQPTGTISWAIKSDNAGKPGTTLQSGTFNPVVSSMNTVDVTNGVTLNANTVYWLEMNSTTDQTNPSYWTWRGGTNPAGTCAADQTCNAGRCVLTTCLNGGSCDALQCTPTGTGGASPSPTPSASPISSNCSLSFSATAPDTQIVCSKTAYRDEFSNSAGNYSLLQQQSTFNPGDKVVFRINQTNNGQTTAKISLTDALSGSGLNNFTFLDSNCGDGAYNASTRTLSCPKMNTTAGQSTQRIFRVKIANNVSGGSTITNTANVSADSTTASCSVPIVIAMASPSPTPSPTPGVTPSPSPSPSPSPTYSCNGSCTTDEQCRSVNAGYICSVEAGYKCRLDSNRNSETCTPPTNSYSCNSGCTTNAQCQTANSSYICYSGNCRLDSNPTAANCLPNNYQPSPMVGCNYSCNTNADCASGDHICFDTSSGKRCRLANYPNSETCTTPKVVYSSPTTTTVTQQPQPEKPVKLPVAGTGDKTIKFFMVGAGAVILGALGLLLL